jgi:hypothetical protein
MTVAELRQVLDNFSDAGEIGVTVDLVGGADARASVSRVSLEVRELGEEFRLALYESEQRTVNN